MIWFTSDFHFNHDREFIWRPRGFKSIEEMNNEMLQRFNAIVGGDDEVYILGDLFLGGAQSLESGLGFISQLNGNLHIVRGNHDTDKRWNGIMGLDNVVEMDNSIFFNYNGYHFYLSHYPSISGSLHQDDLKKIPLNLYGHTHQSTNFFQDMPFMYHVGVDSHNCKPVNIEDIITEMNYKMFECKEFL